MKLATDETGVKAPVVGFSSFTTVSFNSSSSANSSVAAPDGCNAVRVVATEECFINFDTAANKTTSMFLTPGNPEYVSVSPTVVLSVIGNTSSGILNIGFVV